MHKLSGAHASHDTWQGVTYKEDKPAVMAALKGLKEDGLYPERLWGNTVLAPLK